MTGSNITTFDIYSNYNKPAESVANATASLFYYESILDNTIRVTATFSDTGNRDSGGDTASLLEQLGVNLNAGEKVELVLEDDFKQKISLKGDYSLRIKQIRNVVEDTIKSTFTIDFYSKECIDNELVDSRVTKRYDGKITDAVEKILKTDCIKTPKNVEIDPCINDFNFIGNTEKPFYKLVWLAKRCVPDVPNAKGNLAGYFFYETGDNGRGIIGGYKFKSIDKLFEQKPIRKMILNNTTSIPLAYDTKILEYSFDSTVDIENSAITGSLFNTELKSFELFNNEYKLNDFDYTKQFNENNIGGLESFKISNEDLQDKSTRIFDSLKSIGVLPTGTDSEQQIKNSKNENLNIDEIIRQSSNRYNNLFNVKLSIAIFGDFGIHVGDLIHCDFPEVSNKKNTEISKKKSGVYLVVDLCHYISPSGPTYTRLNLVRESFGRKPMNI
jgi:hypothetical protein